MTRARRTERPPVGHARGAAGKSRAPHNRASAAALRDRTPSIKPEAAHKLLLGRYRLRKRIGAGATSTVWLGHDEHLDRAVAVKILHPHLLVDDAARERLDREARTAARLTHPNVVAVFDAIVTNEEAAVVLEHVPGEGLDDRLRRSGPMLAVDAARVGAELASALSAAHAEGIVHRDVKPANVLIGDDGRARLADFGIAQALEDGAAALTEAGSIIGTLRYMSPERLEGQAPTPAADVWGLGAVLLEAITGRPPYDARTPMELLEAARLGPPDLSGVPESLATSLRGMLSPEPTARPAADELQARLAAAAELSAPVAAGDQADAPTEVIAIPESASTAAAAPRPDHPPTSRRSATVAVAIAAGVVIVLLFGAIWADNSANAPDPAGGAPASALASPTVNPTPAPTEKPPGRKGGGKHKGGEGD
jgi:serine/threonine protein kinase